MYPLIIILVFFPFFANGKWLGQKDSQSVVESALTKYHVNKDYTYKFTQEILYNIVSEKMRDQLSLYNITYNPDTEVFKLLQAYVITQQGKKINVDKNKIQIQDVASPAKGFSKFKKVNIPFKNSEIGGKLFIAFEVVVKELKLDHYFSLKYNFLSSNYLYKNEKVQLSSDVKLYFETYDPEKLLAIKNHKNKWTVSLKKPQLKHVVNENYAVNIDKHTPKILFSSVPRWQDFNKIYYQQLAPRLNEHLPDSLLPIVNKISSLSKTEQKIRATLEYIITNYTYLGDWRAVKGAYIPRPLKEIVDTKYGDCKDFSLLMVKILQQAKVDAYPALIYRNNSELFNPFKEPFINAFNHMIVAVKINNKFEHYDPTNQLVIWKSIRYDIDDRDVLNITPQYPGLEKTAKIDTNYEQIKIKLDVQNFDFKNQTVSANFQLNLGGRIGRVILLNLLNASKPEAEQVALGSFLNSKFMLKSEFNSFPQAQRELPENGLHITGRVSYSSSFLPTSAGMGVVDINTFSFPMQIDFSVIHQGYVSDVWLTKPMKLVREVNFPIKNLKGHLPNTCEVNNEFIHVKTNFKRNRNNIQRFDFIHIKKTTIPNEKLNNKSLQQQLLKMKQCLDPFVYIMG
ncbi:MAG: DUF3857 domain-containing protein [Bdellovibrionales bacterium]|nr:DUF3857 domain-containing protein [Bdellovibrionales bacterium]